jgi:hypothetical protein
VPVQHPDRDPDLRLRSRLPVNDKRAYIQYRSVNGVPGLNGRHNVIFAAQVPPSITYFRIGLRLRLPTAPTDSSRVLAAPRGDAGMRRLAAVLDRGEWTAGTDTCGRSAS